MMDDMTLYVTQHCRPPCVT